MPAERAITHTAAALLIGNELLSGKIADKNLLVLARALRSLGVKLARDAQERLDRAERRVEELLGLDAQGRPVLRALEG